MKNKKITKFILAGFLLAGMVVLGISLTHLSRQPLAAPLVLEPRMTVTEPGPPDGTSLPPQEEILGKPTPTSTVSASQKEVCGQGGASTILIIGSDAGDLRGRPGSDLTRLARVNFSDKQVSIFALPRDLWVDVRNLGFRNPLISETTLGEVYYEAYARSSQADVSGKMSHGAQFFAQMILDNFGVTSNHYIVIDLSRIPALIDAIGGLPIVIPEQTTDPWIATVIEAGSQVLTGEQLISYARAIPDSDFARIQRNNLILHALRQKLLDPDVWIRIPGLFDRFNEMLVTDLSPELILSFVCLLREVPREEIFMGQVEPEFTSPGPSDSLLWDIDQVTAALRQLDLLP